MESAIRRAIADHLGVSPALILDAVRLQDLDADDRDRVGLALTLEKSFGLRIPDEALERWSTVADVMRSVRTGPSPSAPA